MSEPEAKSTVTRDDKPDRGRRNILLQTWSEFQDDRGLRLAAALAYYTVLALPPMLVVILLTASFFMKSADAVGAGGLTGGGDSEAVVSQPFEEAVGEENAEQIVTMMREARDSQKSGWRGLIGLAVVLVTATAAVAQLQAGLNDIWEVEAHPQSTIKDFILKRLLSLGMVIGIGLLVVLSVTLSAAISALPNDLLPGQMAKWGQSLVVNGVTFVVMTLLFAALFKFLPDAEVNWSDTWIGAAVTAGLFVAAKFVLGFYLGKSDPGAAFGEAGPLIAILVWVYYSMVITLFGAEFTQVYARRHGAGIVPDKDAVRLIEKTERLSHDEAKAVADLPSTAEQVEPASHS